ncbi:4-coumarate--CoA ligase-like 5 [Vigna angularis]|uniref:4-coumarate--CoA ligase-like 5 n=1 Tax=Phaseolus angularis TaxID=3914 RepID=A0A8T0KP51_PHAAN|nr:4-coumarate--CoA ligase-like 5 [Vigna angularis]
MSGEEVLSSDEEQYDISHPPFGNKSGYNSRTGIYHSLVKLQTKHEIPTKPDLNTAHFVLSQFPQAHLAVAKTAFIDARTNLRVSYSELRRSTYSLASALFHGLEVRKGDVVFLLSPNSTLYSAICLAVLSVGAVLTTANPINTASEIAKQVRDSGAKLAISTQEELHKLVPTGVPTILTSRSSDGRRLSVEELIEGTTGISKDKDAKAHPDSCGKLIPTFSAKVIDTETGKPLPPNKEGELWLKSPTIMKGYLGNLEATSSTIDSEGWLRTGDLSYIDDNGFVHIVERIKELIKHNGYQVAPAELESVLLSHPLIADAAVIPLEDEETGQIPMAYVVRAAGSELSEDQIIQFVAGQVAPYKKVRKVSFIDTIPKSAAGKILRKDLVSQSKFQPVSKL